MPAIKIPAKSRTRRRTTPTTIRHALGRAFLETLEKDFWDHGPQLIEKLPKLKDRRFTVDRNGAIAIVGPSGRVEVVIAPS